MKRCPLFSETAWEDLSEWNYILSLKLFLQFALSILELKTSKKEKTYEQPIEDNERRADLE